ncbi:hypothetical protein V8F06_012130 [Rhypophila decipiens]
MSANNNNNGKNVFFNGPEDWPEWSLTFKRRAVDADIWKYLETKWPTAPKIPQYAQFEAKPRPEEQQPRQEPRNPSPARTRAAHGIAVPSRSKTPRRNYALITGRSHTEDEEDEDDDGENDDGENNEHESEEVENSRLPTPRQIQLSDLTENGRMNYQDAMTRYRIKERQWETIQKDKKALSAWLFDTVHKDYLHLFEYKELEEIYSELEIVSKPFETRIGEQTSIKRFERKMGLWISLWQKSIKDATKYDLIDIYTPAAWCAHLRKALSEITEGKAWVMGEFTILEGRIKRGNLDHNSLAATMQSRISGSPKAEPGRINAGFNTLGGYEERGKKEKDSNKKKRGNEGSRHDNQDQERDRSTRGTPRNNNKKQRTDGITCDLCLAIGHSLDRCYYMYPENDPDLPDWWCNRLDTSQSRFIKKMLEKDADLADRVKKAREKRRMD